MKHVLDIAPTTLFENKNQLYILQKSPTGRQKLRPDQEDKQSCQEIAKRVWNDQQILDIQHLMNHPEILNIVGKYYKENTSPIFSSRD